MKSSRERSSGTRIVFMPLKKAPTPRHKLNLLGKLATGRRLLTPNSNLTIPPLKLLHTMSHWLLGN